MKHQQNLLVLFWVVYGLLAFVSSNVPVQLSLLEMGVNNNNWVLKLQTTTSGVYLNNPAVMDTPLVLGKNIAFTGDNSLPANCVPPQDCIRVWTFNADPVNCPDFFTGSYTFEWSSPNDTAQESIYIVYNIPSQNCLTKSKKSQAINSSTGIYDATYLNLLGIQIVSNGELLHAQSELILFNSDQEVFTSNLWNVWLCVSLNPLPAYDYSSSSGGCLSNGLVDPGAVQIFKDGLAVNGSGGVNLNYQTPYIDRFTLMVPVFARSGFFYVHTELQLGAVRPAFVRLPFARRLLDIGYQKNEPISLHSVQQFGSYKQKEGKEGIKVGEKVKIAKEPVHFAIIFTAGFIIILLAFLLARKIYQIGSYFAKFPSSQQIQDDLYAWSLNSIIWTPQNGYGMPTPDAFQDMTRNRD